MIYSLIITEHADELLDNILQYLICRLCNKQAATHLLDELAHIYDRLQTNPLQFPLSKDPYLAHKGYHEAIVSQMNYLLVFSLTDQVVNIVGIFHQSENYQGKL